MPAVLKKLVKKLESKGHDTGSAFAIATSALQKHGYLEEGSRQLSESGKKFSKEQGLSTRQEPRRLQRIARERKA